jgi:hypothetical protein
LRISQQIHYAREFDLMREPFGCCHERTMRTGDCREGVGSEDLVVPKFRVDKTMGCSASRTSKACTAHHLIFPDLHNTTKQSIDLHRTIL